MARKRTKAAEQQVATPTEQPATEPVAEAPKPEPERPAPPVTEAPDIFDSVIRGRQAAASTETSTPPTAASGSTVRARGDQAERPAPHIANPSSTRRESHADSVTRRLPSKLSVTAGDLKVQMIDAGRNEMGIGIRVAVPEGRRLSDDEKAIIRRHIKGEEGEQTGYTWDANAALWHKEIVRRGEHVDDVPPSRPVAIRLDAERRVEALAEALREHAADPVGYADMVKQRREAAAQDEQVKF